MAREKKPVHKVQMTDGKRNIIQQLLQEYDIQVPQDNYVPYQNFLSHNRDILLKPFYSPLLFRYFI